MRTQLRRKWLSILIGTGLLLGSTAGPAAAQVTLKPGDLLVSTWLGGNIVRVDPNIPDDGMGGNQTEVLPAGTLPGLGWMAISRSGDLFVLDRWTTAAIYRVNPFTGSVSLVSSAGDPLQVPLLFPQGIAIGPSGDLFVSDSHGPIIRVDPTVPDDGMGGNQTRVRSSVPPNHSGGIGVAANGDLLVADRIDLSDTRGRLLRVNPNTGSYSIVTSALAAPWGIAVAPNDDVFVAEDPRSTAPKRVVRVAAGGGVTVVSSNGEFFAPRPLALAEDGSLFVTDLTAAGVGRIIRIDPNIPDDGMGGNQTVVASGGLLEVSMGIVVVPTLGVNLSVRQNPQPNPVNRGTPLDIELTVSNEGNTEATAVILEDDLWPSAQFQSVVGCAPQATQPFRCALGTLPAGSQRIVTLSVKPLAEGGFANQARVESHELELVSADNADMQTITVAASPGRADLSLTLSVDNDRPDAGSNVTYTLTVENLGPDLATNVSVTDVIPPEFDILNLQLPGGHVGSVSTDPVARLLTWHVGDLAPGASARLDVLVPLEPSVQCARVTNTARVSRVDQEDLDLLGGPNTASQDIVVPSLACADVAVSIDVSDPLPQRGDRISYTVTATNVGGPDTATDVGVEITFPTEFDVVEPIPGAVYDSLTRTVSWNAGTLANGASATLVLQADVGASASGDFVVAANRAMPFAQDDPNGANDSGETVVQTGGADLSVGLDVPDVTRPDFIYHDCVFAIRGKIQVSNLGPAVAENVTVAVSSSLYPTFDVEFGSILPGQFIIHKIDRILPPPPKVILARVGAEVSSTAFDANRANNTSVQATLMVGSFDPDCQDPDCGLGAELVLVLPPLIWLYRWKKRRRPGRGRRMKSGKLLFLAGIVTVLPSPPAVAVPVTFAVDPAQTSLSATFENLVADTQAIHVSGTVTGDVTLAVDPTWGRVASTLQLNGATLAVSDASLALAIPSTLSLGASISGLALGLSGPTLTGNPTAPGTASFDMEGATLTFDAGSVAVTGQVLSTPVDFSVDFGAGPLPLDFAPGSLVDVVAQDLGGDRVLLTLSLPVSSTVSVPASGIETTLLLEGSLVLDAIALVPEPSGELMLGFALLLLAGRAWLASRHVAASPDPHGRGGN